MLDDVIIVDNIFVFIGDGQVCFFFWVGKMGFEGIGCYSVFISDGVEVILEDGFCVLLFYGYFKLFVFENGYICIFYFVMGGLGLYYSNNGVDFMLEEGM